MTSTLPNPFMPASAGLASRFPAVGQASPRQQTARGRGEVLAWLWNTPEASGTARKAPSGSLLGEPSRIIDRASPRFVLDEEAFMEAIEPPPLFLQWRW
jgi:hypothetical protein